MEGELAAYNALELAYLGDAVYELAIRHHLLKQGSRPMVEHNRRAFAMVNAAAQSQVIERLTPHLSPAELDLIRYGRNAKGGSAKSASQTEYRRATGLECLLGYLYLCHESERLEQIMATIIAILNEETQWKTD